FLFFLIANVLIFLFFFYSLVFFWNQSKVIKIYDEEEISSLSTRVPLPIIVVANKEDTRASSDILRSHLIPQGNIKEVFYTAATQPEEYAVCAVLNEDGTECGRLQNSYIVNKEVNNVVVV